MPETLLGSLLLQILIVGYTPGPANIYALAMALGHGRREALVMWLGLLAGFSLAVVTLAVVTHFVGMIAGAYIGSLKYLGAAYILYLAYKLRNRKIQDGDHNAECTFHSGMIVQLTNAKMLLFDLTVFSVFVLPYSHRLIHLLGVSVWLLLAGPGANLLWLLAGSYLRPFFLNYERRINLVSSVALVGCAVYILIG